jgi:hypothetical protein
MMRAWIGAVVFGVVAASAGRARGEEIDRGHGLGIGYKIGNGLGFVGADVIARYIPHVAIDLQANYVSASVSETGGPTLTATGYGLAPTVQAQWKTIGHTPYLGVGLVYVHESLQSVTASAAGFLLNAGYEWRFASGVGVMIGAGIDELGTIHATDGTTTLNQPGGLLFNIEAGVRYFF